VPSSLRSSLLPLLFAFSASAHPPAPAPGPQLRGVLGQPDLATPVTVFEVTFLDGGETLLALDASGTAQLWDVTRAERRGLVFGPVVRTPVGLKSAPPGRGCVLQGPLVTLSDGRLGRATQGMLRLCDLSGQKPEAALEAPALSEDGTALALSPDGTVVAQGSAFGEVVRFQLPKGEPSRVAAHDGRVLALHLDSSGQLLTAGVDGTVRTFDAQGRRLRSVEWLSAAKRSRGEGCEGETPEVAAFAQDGSAVLLGTVAGDGRDGCPDAAVPARLRLVELPSGKVRWELKGVQASAAAFSGHTELAVAVALRPGEAGDNNPSTVVRLDVKTGAPLDKANGHRAPLTVLRFSADGRALFSGDASGTWKRWALDTGKETLSAAGPGGAILDLRLTADEHVLTQHEDDGVRNWRSDGKLLSLLVAPPKSETTSLSPACRAEEEATRSALASMKARPSPLALRDPGRYAGVTLLPELALSADGESVLAPVAEESCVSFSRNGCPSGCHRNYHLARVSLHTGKTLQLLPVDEELLGGCVPPSGAFVTRDDRAGMNLWAASGTLSGQIGVVLGKVTGCEATPDGRKMLVATARSLSVWDAAAFARPVEAVPRRAQAPGPVAFSPHGDLSVDVDGGQLLLRRWPKGTFVARLMLGPHDDAPTALAFTPDGQTLAVGTARGVIYLYALPGSGQTAQQAHQAY
jgi:WD40 repeat protein